MLQVLVLGAVEARADGGAIRLGGPKQRILLALLALAEGRPVTRARLIEALWGEDPPGDPEHALNAYVSRLRAALQVEIPLSPGGYRLDLKSVELDVVAFAQRCERGRRLLEEATEESIRTAAATLRDALAMWRGPAFADLPDVAALAPARAGLAERRQEALADRIDADLRSRADAGVVSELEALLVEQPLRERHWAQLMVALHLQGRESEALEAYQRAREVLVEQLGTEPGEMLAGLHQSILRGEPQGTEARQPAPAGREAAGLPGREHELAALGSAWSEAQHGLRIVTVSGDAGIGKTRLAEEFASRLADDGVRVLSGRCDQALVAPYQPVLEVLRADLAGLEGDQLLNRLGERPEELARLLPELGHRLPALPTALPSDPGIEVQRAFAAVAGWLSAASAAAPLLVFIDDLHWADRQTLLLLRHLVRSPQPARVLLIGTVRDREHPAGAGPGDLLGELVRQSERVRHLPLGGLGDDAISALLEVELSGAGTAPERIGDLTRHIAAASGGSPLFAVELARHLTGQGSKLPVAETPTTVPAGIRELVEGRLAQLPAETADLLRRAAVGGREFDPLVLQDVTGHADGELDELLQAATYTRMIEPVPGRRLRYRFSHDLVRGVLYDSIAPLAKARAHGEIAVAIERLYADDLARHHPELAHHFAAAAVTGPTDRAVHYLMLAGADALEQRAPWVALDHHRRASELVPDDAPYALRCDLLTALGVSAFHAGDPSYRETLLAAARLASGAGDGPRLIAAVVANHRGWWSSTGAVDHERVALIESALAKADPQDRVAQVQLLTTWALENVRDPSRRALVLQRSWDAARLAEEIGDDYLLATALSHRYAVVYATFSDPRGCVELSERIIAVARRRGDPGLRLNGMIGLAQATMLLGEFDVADRALDEALDLARTLDQPARLWLASGWRAMCVGMRGDLERAEVLAVEAFELGERTSQPDALTWFSGQLFTLRLLASRLPELIEDIEQQVVTQADGIPAWRAAYALALTTVGRQAEAGAILDEFVDHGLVQLPIDLLWLHGMTYLGGVCAALERPDAAESLYDALAPYAGLVAHNGTIDAGPVDLTLAVLARVAGDHEAAEKHLSAAGDLCRRIDAPGWLAEVHAERVGR